MPPTRTESPQGHELSLAVQLVGRFWHDRVERPTNLVPTTRASDADRTQAWAWLRDAAGLGTAGSGDD